MSKGFMYILECSNSALYVGSTKYLEKRLEQHQNGEGDNFTKKHLPVKLLYFEEYTRIDHAYHREKQVQGWSRKKKIALINGQYNDLHLLAECRSSSHWRSKGISAALNDLTSPIVDGSHRLIGRYSHGRPGPLLVAIGGMHGNEPAGVNALITVLDMLHREDQMKDDFDYNGTFLAIKGNRRALSKGLRFIDKDLNRSWTDETIKLILEKEDAPLNSEQIEIKEILDLLKSETASLKPEKIIMLDLHTTSSKGGIFSITTDDDESIQIATELHAPVIKGMLTGITGSSIHFFSGKNMGIPTTAIAFESGQHEDELSVNRAIAAVINCMRTIGAVDAYHVENKHDEILIAFSKELPKVSRIVGKHSIIDNDKFRMLPDYKSFQEIHKGELLAYDKNGEVRSPIDGRILMPFYQKQGEDGFFLIQSE